MRSTRHSKAREQMESPMSKGRASPEVQISAPEEVTQEPAAGEDGAVVMAVNGAAATVEITVRIAKARLHCPVCTLPLKPPIFHCVLGHLACGVCQQRRRAVLRVRPRRRLRAQQRDGRHREVGQGAVPARRLRLPRLRHLLRRRRAPARVPARAVPLLGARLRVRGHRRGAPRPPLRRALVARGLDPVRRRPAAPRAGVGPEPAPAPAVRDRRRRRRGQRGRGRLLPRRGRDPRQAVPRRVARVRPPRRLRGGGTAVRVHDPRGAALGRGGRGGGARRAWSWRWRRCRAAPRPGRPPLRKRRRWWCCAGHCRLGRRPGRCTSPSASTGSSSKPVK